MRVDLDNGSRDNCCNVLTPLQLLRWLILMLLENHGLITRMQIAKRIIGL